MRGRGRRYDRQYTENVRLSDGTVVRLRLIRPEDKALLREGFRELSVASRYRRFFGAKTELSDRDLAYLTEVDGQDHFAIGATLVRDDGSERGLGIARFVREPRDPGCAEAAVAVIDAYQSRGLGKILLRRLSEAARERGITHFRSTILSDNPPIRAMLRQGAARLVEQSEADGVIQVDLALPSYDEQRPSRGEAAHLLERVLGAVAKGAARILPRR